MKARGETPKVRMVDFLRAVLARKDVVRVRPGNKSTLVGLGLRP